MISVCAALVLSAAEQTREIYRILAQDITEGTYTQSAFALVFGATAAVLIWLIARNLTLVHATEAVGSPGINSTLLRWLPQICGALIPIGMGIGLWMASTDITLEGLSGTTLERIPQLGQIRDQMAATALLLRFASALQFGLAAALLGLTWLRSPAHTEWKRSRFLFGVPGGLALLVLVAAISTYLVASPVTVPQLLGTTAIVLILVIVLAFVASMLTAYFDRHGIPAVTILLLLAALFSAFDWNDNHLVRMEKLADFTRFPNAKDAFKEWLSSREDREHYKSLRQPYPVFLVTAAGGGLYAAHHAATVLARLQDRCPSFAQHVFAVSAVSGGSLGAATFVSLASRFAVNGPARDCAFGPLPDKGEFERRTHKFLEGDFLAPVVAAGLFPDLLQRLIPYPIERFDRARALEASFELAWARGAGAGLRQSFRRAILRALPARRAAGGPSEAAEDRAHPQHNRCRAWLPGRSRAVPALTRRGELEPNLLRPDGVS